MPSAREIAETIDRDAERFPEATWSTAGLAVLARAYLALLNERDAEHLRR